MKNFLLFILLFLLVITSYAQNKTLGVGVAVPNPNAALDVDSPTGNQGMLIPRLTSAQITALGLVLGAADKGMMIYNKETDNLIIWNGAAFGISVAATSTNANAAVLGTTTGTGAAGVFQNTNAANTSSALYGVTNGTGNAIAVRGDITNATNTSAAVYGSTVGSGVGLYGISTGTGAAIQGYTTTAPTAIFGRHDGATLGYAGLFSITNTSNAAPSLRATTISTGSAGDFQITNAGNTAPVINITHAGTGNAITANRPIQATSFIANNDGVGQGGFFTKSNGSGGGSAIEALNYGIDDGAAAFGVLNAASPRNTIFAQTTGTGAVAYLTHNGPSGNIIEFNNNFSPVASIDKTGKITATQFVGEFVGTSSGLSLFPYSDSVFTDPGPKGLLSLKYNNPRQANMIYLENIDSSTVKNPFAIVQRGAGAAMTVTQNYSSGTGAIFSNTKSSNAFAALRGQSNGQIAIQGNNNSAGNGFAGLFRVSQSTNTYPAIQASTAGTGTGVRVIQDATSVGGGMDVIMQNTTGTALGFSVNQQGLGGAANFTINNPASTSAALVGTTTGTGAAIQGTTSTGFTSVYGRRDGATNGNAGLFDITNAANTFPALQTNTVGSGTALIARTTGTGGAGYFQIANATNTLPALASTTDGTGQAASFNITNASSSANGISSVTNSTGAAIFTEITGGGYAALDAKTSGSSGSGIYAHIDNAANGGSAINATTAGTGAAVRGQTSTGFAAVHGIRDGATNGHAGLFQNTNPANSFPPVQIVAAGNSSNALYINHTGSGGNLVVFANSDVPAARIDKTGKGIFNGGTQTGGADIAEMFDVEGARESYEPGDVLVISESTDRTVEKSSTTNSTKVVGVYATKPGVTLTEKGIDENLDQLVPMGVIGVIPTKVCLENGAIKRGDLLVTSSKSGHAMKAVSAKGDGVFPAGVIIGKALENFEHGESGLIKVLVNVK